MTDVRSESNRQGSFITSKEGKAYVQEDPETKVNVKISTKGPPSLHGQGEIALNRARNTKATKPTNKSGGNMTNELDNYGMYGLYGSPNVGERSRYTEPVVNAQRTRPNTQREQDPQVPLEDTVGNKEEMRRRYGETFVPNEDVRIPEDDGGMVETEEDTEDDGPKDFSKGVTFSMRLFATFILFGVIFAICFAAVWPSITAYEDFSKETGGPSFSALFLGNLLSLAALAYAVSLISETMQSRRNLVIGVTILYMFTIILWHINLATRAEVFKYTQFQFDRGTSFLVISIAFVVGLMVLLWDRCRTGLIILMVTLIWNLYLLYWWLNL